MKFKIIISIAFILLASFTVYQYISNNKKTGFINISKLYNEFDYKIEQEKKLENVKLQRQNSLDSLKLQIDIISRSIESGNKNDSIIHKYKVLIETYKFREQQYYEDNQTLANQYQEEIFTQLNQYVEDYGIENDFLYIHGANNNGALMYAAESKDITPDVLQYINEKYQGKSNEL